MGNFIKNSNLWIEILELKNIVFDSKKLICEFSRRLDIVE